MRFHPPTAKVWFFVYNPKSTRSRRGGRVAEGGGLLNRYRG